MDWSGNELGALLPEVSLFSAEKREQHEVSFDFADFSSTSANDCLELDLLIDLGFL